MKGVVPVANSSFFDNVHDAARIVPLNAYGNFGSRSRKKGSRACVYESDNPARTAYEFQSAAARGYIAMMKIRHGQVMTMSDGTVITYRMRSLSRDHTPVVVLQVHNMPIVKSQKIHFIPRGQMSGVNFTIAQEGIELLRAAKGTTMVSLEAVIVARGDMAWGTVRIHLADSVSDVVVGLQDQPLNSDGDVEEFGVLTVFKAESGALSVEGVDKEAGWCDVGVPVTGITLVNDHVSAFEGGRETMERSFTQAIVFALADGSHLVLDKGAWFSEMITIGKGAAWKDCVYDSSHDWENDPEEPEVRYVWERTLEDL